MPYFKLSEIKFNKPYPKANWLFIGIGFNES